MIKFNNLGIWTTNVQQFFFIVKSTQILHDGRSTIKLNQKGYDNNNNNLKFMQLFCNQQKEKKIKFNYRRQGQAEA